MLDLIAGLDEAGRGSVIGPMIIAGVLISEEDIDQLIKISVRDSKELKPEERALLYGEIIKIAKSLKTVELSAREVDSQTKKNKGRGINNLEAQVFAEIINNLKPDIAYIDAPSRNIRAFKLTLVEMLKHPCKLIVEHRADKNYPVTAAASIIAKICRDREVEKLRKRFGDFGSGYPHDHKTREFIRRAMTNKSDVTEYIRWSWKTISKLAQTTLEEY
ncbi:MAG: ribonuclease HII [Nitrososphaeria archaeon]|nr:ribonuclease HII [Nitrososphaeria archaeon]